MARSRRSKSSDQVFVKDGRKHYRRAYSKTEPRIGLLILIGLAGILGWVAWKGQHPDPELFATDVGIVEGSKEDLSSQASSSFGGGQSGSESGRSGASPDRSPLPEAITATGWREEGLSRFGPDNLYEKINGREDYYKSFGFQSLLFVSLVHESGSVFVDIECFDMGTSPNALGAYSGERSAGVTPEVDARGLSHYDRNAYFLVRGPYYIRAIGSEESSTVLAQLETLEARLSEALTGESLPWGYSLFVGRLSADPGGVSYALENAMSFSFGRRVYASLAADGETERFATVRQDAASAEALAGQFTEGFLDFGSEAGESGGIRWIEDRYLGTIAGVISSGRWVLGVEAHPISRPLVPSSPRCAKRLRRCRFQREPGMTPRVLATNWKPPREGMPRGEPAPRRVGLPNLRAAKGTTRATESAARRFAGTACPGARWDVGRGLPLRTARWTRRTTEHITSGRHVSNLGRGRMDDARETHAKLRRRAFLKQLGTVAAVGAGATWMAKAPPSWPLSLRDDSGELGKPRTTILRLPEGGFAVDPNPVLPRLGVARGENIDEMMRASIEAIGGISRFIQRDDVVLIKPNVAFERSAALGATTNPEVLQALVRLVREAQPAEIRVADNPIESPESCFMRSGIRQAAIDVGARVFLPTPSDFEVVNVPGATWIEEWPFFWRPFRGATKVIGVAPVKDHNLCAASMTTKNWYGLLGGRRNQFHQDIHGIISDLALMLRPTFVVLDGTRVLFRNGPTGGTLADVRPGRTLVASTDTLAADAFGWDDLLERKDQERPGYFAQATARGLGDPNWQSANVREVQVG